jgi:hypothetical protein
MLSKQKWDSTSFLEKYYDGRIALENETVTAELKHSQSFSVILSEEIDDKENEMSPLPPVRRMTRKRKLEEAAKEEPAKKTSRATLASTNSSQGKIQKVACEICLESCNVSVSFFSRL